MSVTSELREYFGKSKEAFTDHVLEIADRIDAEHEEAVQQALMGEGGVPATDENMAAVGWVRLPKDADGEYIHIGDRMEGEKIGGGFGEPFEVVGYIMSNGELEPMDEHRNPRKRKYLRHYHAPTVEDVLRDMHAKLDEVTALYVGEAIDSDERDSDEARIFAEYAAKLQLRGDA